MNPISAPNSLIDAQELARQLGIPLCAVYRLSASGKLPRYKLGHRTVRFRLVEVLEALRQEPERDVPPPRGATPSRSGSAPRTSPLPAFDWSPGS